MLLYTGEHWTANFVFFPNFWSNKTGYIFVKCSSELRCRTLWGGVKRPLFYRTSALHSTLVSFIGNDKLTSNGERKAKKREDANEILPPTLIVGTDDDCCCYETLSRALQTSALISTYSTAQHWLLILSISHFILCPHLQYTVFSRFYFSL